MTLQEILANKTTFGDDIELTIGTEKVNLGQLRDLSAKQQKDLSDKIAGADNREKEARDTAMKAATLLSQLEDARTKLEASKKEPVTDDDFDTSEWWKPVKARFAERDTKIDQALKGIEALTKSVSQAATIWAKDRWRGQFDRVAPRLKKVDAYKEWDLDKVLNYATEHKILDENDMPSVEKAVLELTKANDLKTAADEAYERGLKEGRTKARLETMPRPSSATGGKSGKGKSSVEEHGFEGLGDDVMNDAELMESLAKISDIETLQ